eukprot:g22049.t1
MTDDKPVFQGCIPALMTPCSADGQPDFDALVSKARELIDVGMRAVVYCGSMGDWPLLSDAQRQEGVRRLVEAGVPVVVGTGAQNPAAAAAHAAHAKQVGAAGLMVIPRVLSRGTSTSAQRAHFAGILKAAVDLPAVIYNSPYYGFETKADLFFDLHREFPNLIGFKEFGGAESLTYAAEHITSGNSALSLMVGVDTQVFHGFVRCGAVGAITGVGNALPGPVLRLIELCEQAAAGNCESRRLALELDDALAVLSKYDEGPDLVLYYKHLMVLEGNPEYAHHFNATDALSVMNGDANSIRFVDSHTEGEPTRVVTDGGPALAAGSLAERRDRLRATADDFRRCVINEPRGYDAIVGALLCDSVDSSCASGVIFFNNSGYLGMCGHGTIGVAVTLHYLGRIGLGVQRLETPVGVVEVDLLSPNRVAIANVPSYRLHAGVSVEVEGLGAITGDVAWGGNWFFLVDGAPAPLTLEHLGTLSDASQRVRDALVREGITGADGAEIDHIDFFGPAESPDAHSRNFVYCPGGAYDRSPCGTGTSAKLACLAADGKLSPGETWIQESVIGSRFEARYEPADGGRIIPTITGTAYVCSEGTLIRQPGDPFMNGISGRRCNHRQMIRAGEHLQTILDASIHEYRELMAEHAFDCEWKEAGLLYVLRTKRGMDRFAETDRLLMDHFGVAARRIEGDELTALDPGLKPGLAGAFHYPGDASVRPDRLNREWAAYLKGRGVKFIENCEMRSIRKSGGRVTALETSAGDMEADRFVFAMGAWSSRWSKELECRVPIQPGKGYSITMARPEPAVRHPILFPEHKVGVSPFEKGLRLGSMMEFAGYDKSIPPHRIQLLRDSARPYLKASVDGDAEETWYSVGGELRYRHLDERFRLRPQGNVRRDIYEQWRLTPFLQVENDWVTAYVQAIDASTFDPDIPVLPIDVNRADLLQYYADLRLWEFDGKPVRVRYGRQFLKYGSQHLVSPLAWANTFRNFEGFRAYYNDENWAIDGFATQPVNGAALNTFRPTSFDTPDQSRWFSGIYTTYKNVPNGQLDLYWLWLREQEPRLTIMDGNRHTLGVRYAGNLPARDCCDAVLHTWFWDVEAGWQFGSDDFRTGGRRQDVNAGFASATAGLTLNRLPWQPSLKGIFWWGSGDDNPNDNEINTINTLFPLGHAYWGLIDNFNGANLLDYAVSVSVKPTKKLTFAATGHLFEKAQTSDFIYNIAGVGLGPLGAPRNIGQELDLVATYAHSKTLSFQAGYFWFWYGDAVTQTALARPDAQQFYFMTTWGF